MKFRKKSGISQNQEKIRNNQENHEGLDGLQLTKMHMFACMLYNYAFVDMTETDRHGFKITFTKVNLKG